MASLLIGFLGHSSVLYFGWSNGVVVGLRAAEQHPQAFDALVLFGPIAPPTTPEQLHAAVEKTTRSCAQGVGGTCFDEMIPAEKHPVPQWIIYRILATDIEPYIGLSEARPSWNWSPWDALPQIDAPTLMLVGELEDPTTSWAKRHHSCQTRAGSASQTGNTSTPSSTASSCCPA